MKKEKDDLRDLMQGVFHDYEVAPDPEDWNRIEKTLSERKKRRILPWIIWASAAGLLLLLAIYTGGILNRSEITTVRTAVNQIKYDKPSAIQKNNTTNSTQTVQYETKAPTAQIRNKKPAEKMIQKAKATESNNMLLAANRTNQAPAVATFGKVTNTGIIKSDESINTTERGNLLVHAISPKVIRSIANAKSMRDRSKDVIFNRPVNNNYKKNDLYLLASNSASIKFKGISLSNNSGLILQSSSSSPMMSYDGAFASQLASNMYLNSVKVFDNSFLSSINIGNLFQNKSRDYLPPVTFGLNVNLSLKSTLSIETGIQYTRLQSNGSVSINSSSAVQITTSFGYKVKENLYYLGVPVIINYNFYQKRKTSLYLSCGFSVEKGLIAKYEAIPENNFPGMNPIYSHDAIRGLQYSIHSGLGISYKFIRHFEVFGQPSVTYYFKSKEKNTTIYIVHPTIFNLRTGIRYTIK